MNYERIYEYRFQGINSQKKKIIWEEIAQFIYKRLGSPNTILDPAAGKCEFINTVPSKERWGVDLNEYFIRQYADKEIKIIIGDNLKVDLPQDYFDAVYISNFLEHLYSQDEVADFLTRMFHSLKKGGKIAVMGPNFKYTYRQYFDFADHTVILSELGIAEHLYGAGFTIDKIYPRFLPLSFRERLPINRFLARLYMQMPFVWPLFGKQFLVFATK